MLLGRQDGEGKPLLDDQPTTTDHIAAALGKAFPNLLTLDSVTQRLQRIAQSAARPQALEAVGMQRIPILLRLPHNSSTKLPEGAGGRRCWLPLHGHLDGSRDLYLLSDGWRRRYLDWPAGLRENPHIFQNLGDGTYFHSGSLAIRAAVSAGVNITYKLLFNDAVAMTGGQPVDGQLTVQQISQQAALEASTALRWSVMSPKNIWAAGLRQGHLHTSPTGTGCGTAGPSGGRGRVAADLRPDLRLRETPASQARTLS